MALFASVENGDLNTLKRLVNNQNESDVVDYVNSQNPITGISLLHIAVKHGFLDICEYLQQMGALIDITDLKDRTPLHYGAKGSHYEICNFLIENGAFIDAKDIFILIYLQNSNFIFLILFFFMFLG